MTVADTDDRRWLQLPSRHSGGMHWSTTGSLVAGATGLQLAADSRGSFRINSRDGSLGRLTLPRGIAIDGQRRVYLLDRQKGLVLRHDSRVKPGVFQPLPCIGQTASHRGDPRWFRTATSITVDRDCLYVVVPYRRVLVFSLQSLALCAIWPFPNLAACGWVCDAVAHLGVVDVLTSNYVFRFQSGDVSPQRFLSRDGGRGWCRLAADRSGQLYIQSLGNNGAAELSVYRPIRGSAPVRTIKDAAQVRDRFDVPELYTLPGENKKQPLRYVMPASLCSPCRSERKTNTDLTHVPSSRLEDADHTNGFVFDQHGNRINSDELINRPQESLCQRSGASTTSRLDSRLFRCQWDRLDLTFAHVPTGSHITLDTSSSDLDDLDPNQIAETNWVQALSISGTHRDPLQDPFVQTDCLVGSGPGRYLYLRITMQGDGFATPVLEGIRLHFPRQSYLEYLPAVFVEDDECRRFLERFLAIFQFEWDKLEDLVRTMERQFNPAAVREKQLPALARWFGIEFDDRQSEAHRRDFLKALPRLVFAERKHTVDRTSARKIEEAVRPGGVRRGTPNALRDYVAAILGHPQATNSQAANGTFPFIIEGFRRRDYRIAAETGDDSPESAATSVLPAALPLDADPGLQAPAPLLWDSQKVKRFQLGVSRLDEAKLLPKRKPELDVFHHHAHRFEVIVPACWVPTDADEHRLRKAIEAEKPAHTQYELQLIEAGFCVGEQARVGIDTIVGGPSSIRLKQPNAIRHKRPTGGGLGVDTVLSPANPGGDAFVISPDTRLEMGANQL